MKKRILIQWLLGNGFVEQPGRKTSHRTFKHSVHGTKITIAAHGKTELTQKHLGMLRRQLAPLGLEVE
jgi:predicted RNA binding protein YcfA (HicA-like mRNA interferase family)